MSWFKRKNKDDVDPVAWTEGDTDGTQGHEAGAARPEPRAGGVTDVLPQESVPDAVPAPDRAAGPFDVGEVAGPEGYLDLGGIWLPGRDGMELRLEVEEATGRVTAATVQLGASAVQLQAFAAPRTAGIWDEIRAEIASGVTRQGGTADEVPGTFGQELLTRIPVRAADGRTTHQPARFIGVDGPRWFLRAVFHGAAAYEPSAAEDLEGLVREVVVVRGVEAMAPRELLALRLPEAAGSPDGDGDEEAGPEGQDPLEPFRRGPEITEVR